MDASEYIRKKMGKANYSDFRRKLEAQPGGCTVECSKVSCQLRYPGYEFRNSIRIGKGVCDCTDSCFLETGQTGGDGFLLGDMLLIQNEPIPEYFIDDEGNYIVMDDESEPFLLRSILLGPSETPLKIVKKKVTDGSELMNMTIDGYVKELPFKLVNTDNSHFYVIGSFIDYIIITTPTQEIPLYVYEGAKHTSLFIIKVSKDFIVEAISYIASSTQSEPYSASIQLIKAEYKYNKLYLLWSATNMEPGQQGYAVMYKKASNISPLDQSDSSILESYYAGEHIYLMEVDAMLVQDPFIVINKMPVNNIATNISDFIITETNIYYYQQFSFEDEYGDSLAADKYAQIVDNVTEQVTNIATTPQNEGYLNDHFYIMEINKNTYERTYMRTIKSIEPITVNRPFIENDNIIIYGNYASSISVRENTYITSKYVYNTPLNAYMYNMSKTSLDLLWGINIGYIRSLFTVEKVGNEYVIIGTYGSSLIMNDTDHALRNRTNFTLTGINNEMNIFIAKSNETGYIQDVLRLSGTGTVYEPLFVKFNGNNMLLVIRTDAQPIFTRLVDRSMTNITSQGGTGDVYIIKYDADLNCIWYSRITMNMEDTIREVVIDNNIIVSGITSVINPVYETSYGKKYAIDTPDMDGRRGFRIKIRA
jgi:hypothetical protein